MKDPQSEWKQAYLDEEMSSEEKADFEANLSQEDQSSLRNEANFNSALNQHLKKVEVPCPDSLWNSVQKNILSNKTQPIQEVSNFQNLLPTLLKMAAVCLIAIALNLFWSPNNTKNINLSLDIQPSIEGQLFEIQQLLNQQGYNLNFKQIPIAHHKINFVGMDWLSLTNEPQKQAARLIFHCCDIPVILYIKQAQTEPSTAVPMEREHRSLLYHSKKANDKYLIDAYSDHPPAEVLDLIY
jgi:hypothetical protein